MLLEKGAGILSDGRVLRSAEVALLALTEAQDAVHTVRAPAHSQALLTETAEKEGGPPQSGSRALVSVLFCCCLFLVEAWSDIGTRQQLKLIILFHKKNICSTFSQFACASKKQLYVTTLKKKRGHEFD